MSGSQHGYADPSTDKGAADETDEVDLQMLCLTGEGVTLSVPRSMLGYELRRLVSEKLPFKPGAKLAVHHANTMLALNQTLAEQGIVGKSAMLSCTYIPTNVYTAWCYVCGLPTSEREFALEGVTQLGGSDGWRVLTLSPPQPCKIDFWLQNFNQSLERVTLPSKSSKLEFWPGFQPKPGAGDLAIESSKLEFWPDFQPKPGAGDLAIESSKLEFWQECSTKAWSGWPCHRVFKAWVLAVSVSTKAWSGWPCHRVFKAWVLAGFQPKPGAGDLAIESSKLEFWWSFNQSLEQVTLPSSLQSLRLWWAVSTKAWSGWPCHRVFKAWVLVKFNQSLERVTLPSSLQSLSFGQPKEISTKAWSGWPCHRVFKAWVLAISFNQSLERVTLPSSLQSLSFGTVSTKAWSRWPCHRVFKAWVLAGWSFNQSLERVTLPSSLQSLSFGYAFNQSLERVTLPSSLQSLSFGQDFNQSLERVTLPSSLQSLSFGNQFNQSLERVTLPSSLQSLSFGSDFNQSLERVTLPSSLQRAWVLVTWWNFWFWWEFQPKPGAGDLAIESSKLEFWYDFNQSLERVTLPFEPSKLEFWHWISTKAWSGWPCHRVFKAWVLANDFNQSLERVTLPSSLQSLSLAGKCLIKAFCQPKPGSGAGDLAIEPSKLEFWPDSFNQSLERVTLPSSLQSFTASHRHCMISVSCAGLV